MVRLSRGRRRGLLVATLIGVLVVGGCTPRRVFHDSVLLLASRDGQRLQDDDSIDLQFAGGFEVPQSAVWIAACHASVAVQAGQSLNASVVVVTDPAYYRVAEMVSANGATRAEAEAIETAIFAEPALLGNAPRLGGRSGIPVARVREYIALRSRSAEVSARYLVYVHSLTTRQQRLVIIDVDRFLELLEDSPTLYPDETIRIAGQQPVKVMPDACHSLKLSAG